MTSSHNSPDVQATVRKVWEALGPNEKASFLSLLVGFPADANLVKLLVKLSTAQIRQAFGSKHRVVIVGPTNVGKSTLYNQLVQNKSDQAVVGPCQAPQRKINRLMQPCLPWSIHPVRIINVSSGAHTTGKIEFDNLQGERGYSPRVYENSKLANILFTMELARRLEGTTVTVNALHPGFTATGFAKNNGKFMAALISLFAPLVGRSPAKGAETSIYLASSPSVEGITGEYFYDSHVIPAAPQATDILVARKLWDGSAKMVHLADGLPAAA